MSSGGRRNSLLNFFSRSSSAVDERSDVSSSQAGNNKSVRGPARTAGGSADMSEGSEVMEVFENERYRDQIGWSGRNLELDDPKNFSWLTGSSDQFISPPPPPGYEFLGIWELDKKAGTVEGWLYARSFALLSANSDTSTDGRSGAHRTRRRRWIREMKRRDDAPMPEDCADTLASSDEETQNSGSAEERSAEKYIFLKLGSGGNTGGTPTKGAVADEEETRSSVTGGDGGSRQSLRLLGMQIRELELECEREADTAVKEWKLTQYPMYRATVREIEKAVSALEDQIKKESNVSEEHVLSLEETLKAHVDVLNATKKRMYFPNSNLSSGSADAFFAIDDFWVEDVSGVFVVDMIGSLSSPQVIVNLTGTADGPNSGVNVKLKLEGFKLRAKGAPSISVQETVLTACVKMSMMLTFVAASNKWQLLPADFRLDLLAFSGPYGLSRAFVSTILSMVGGKIREAILVALPMEVGHLLMTLPIPFAVRGEFAVRGTPLSLLCSPLDEAQGLCQSLGFNPGHMKVFMELQKKIGRGARGGPLLKTMQDMINYRTMGAKNSKLWEKLVKLWNNAATVFIEMKVEEVAAAAFAAPVGEGSGEKGIGSSHLFGYNTNAVTVLATFSFDDIVQAVEDVMRKPLSIEFKLHHISGQVSVNQVIDKLRRLAHRLALISAKVGKNTTRGANDDIFMDKRVSALLKRATREFDDAKKVLGILAQNFDYGQVLADVHMKSGAAGDITVRASQILGRAPISIWLNLPQRLAFLGIHCPVPYVMALKTDPEGNMVIEFNHVGSSKTTRRGVFMRHEDAKDRSQNKVRVRARRRSINWRAQWASKLSEKKVKALDEESKFHLSPLISISDSYTLPTETHLDDITMRESFSLMDGDHIRGKLSSSFSKLSSKMKSVVPMMPRKKVIDEAVPNLAATSHSAVKSSNIFIVPTKHANNVAKQIFTDVPVTAADFDDDEDDNLEEEVDEERELENESADESQSQGAVESTSDIATNAVDVNTENQPEVYSPSKPRTSIPVLRSYRRKARLEQTLGAVPKEDEVVEVASAIVYKPKVTIVTEKAVSLRAGAELLTFSLGKTSAAGVGDSEVHIESIVTPTFREREQSATAPTVMLTAASLKIKRDMKNEENYDAVSVSNASVSDSERVTDASWTEDKTAIDEYKNSGLDVPEYRRNVIGEADGSPVVVQTGTGIKVLVEVPRVDIRVGIADMLRFINRFMGSNELTAWLGAQNEAEEGDFDELIAFVKAVVARAGKYFLLPGLQCELCIVGKLVVVNGEVVVKVETPVMTNSTCPSDTSISDRIEKADGLSVIPEKDQSDLTNTHRESRADTGRNIFMHGGSFAVSTYTGNHTVAITEPRPFHSSPRKGFSGINEDEEEDFWANLKISTEGQHESATSKKIKKECESESSVRAAYVKISMNMMDVIEDHKVLTSLGQDLILALLSKSAKLQRKKITTSSKKDNE